MNQPAPRFRWLSAIVACALCACAPSTKSAPSVEDRETAQMAPIIAHVKNAAILGSAIEGTTLVISADVEKWSELDDSTEADFKAAVLAGWVKTWKHEHPRGHARLRVLIRNYYGQEMTSVTKGV